MSLTFINCTAETFTPSKSGAIATWNWEVCQAAQKEGIEPLVITRSRDDVAAYPWARTTFIEYPKVPNIPGIGRLFEFQRRQRGWGHIRQGAYLRRVADAIRHARVERGTFMLQNDIEMAVYLRKAFPDAFLLHHAQNDNGVGSKRCREQFRHAVNVASACSNWTREWNEKYYGFSPGTMKTIYNGANAEKFHPLPEIPDRKPVINFHGRIDEHKAPDLLLKAALRVAERTTAFSIQIVGRKYYWTDELDEYQASLLKLGDELQARGVAVNFTGWIDRDALPETLRQADIHVTTSRWNEPCALTTFEAMATGLATVGSRTGGTPEVIGEAGLFFERDDVDQLSARLFDLVSRHDLRREMGRRARERALKLTWQHTWNSVKELLPK